MPATLESGTGFPDHVPWHQNLSTDTQVLGHCGAEVEAGHTVTISAEAAAAIEEHAFLQQTELSVTLQELQDSRDEAERLAVALTEAGRLALAEAEQRASERFAVEQEQVQAAEAEARRLAVVEAERMSSQRLESQLAEVQRTLSQTEHTLEETEADWAESMDRESALNDALWAKHEELETLQSSILRSPSLGSPSPPSRRDSSNVRSSSPGGVAEGFAEQPAGGRLFRVSAREARALGFQPQPEPTSSLPEGLPTRPATRTAAVFSFGPSPFKGVETSSVASAVPAKFVFGATSQPAEGSSRRQPKTPGDSDAPFPPRRGDDTEGRFHMGSPPTDQASPSTTSRRPSSLSKSPSRSRSKGGRPSLSKQQGGESAERALES